MVSLVLIGLSILLFAGFLSLTRYEARQEIRVFRRHREALDLSVKRMSFIFEHVDFEAFLREVLRTLALRLTHDIAHLSLLTVRFAERMLTRAVKHLRTNNDLATAPALAPRPFVKAMSDFKQQLAATRVEAP